MNQHSTSQRPLKPRFGYFHYMHEHRREGEEEQQQQQSKSYLRSKREPLDTMRDMDPLSYLDEQQQRQQEKEEAEQQQQQQQQTLVDQSMKEDMAGIDVQEETFPIIPANETFLGDDNNTVWLGNYTGPAGFVNDTIIGVVNGTVIGGGSGGHMEHYSASSIVGLLLWAAFMLYCCCERSNRPPPELWRGEEIRRQYRRTLQRQRQAEKRSGMSVEDRTELVELCLRTKRVIGKDRNGNLRLGSVNAAPLSPTSAAVADAAATPASPTPSSAALSISASTATTAPMICHPVNDFDDDDEDEEQACVICLDTFHVNDLVSWSKIANTPCQHVFHAECIKPWLVGYSETSRHDDCPSCRTNFILYNALKEKRKKLKKLQNSETEGDEAGGNDERGSDGDGQTAAAAASSDSSWEEDFPVDGDANTNADGEENGGAGGDGGADGIAPARSFDTAESFLEVDSDDSDEWSSDDESDGDGEDSSCDGRSGDDDHDDSSEARRRNRQRRRRRRRRNNQKGDSSIFVIMHGLISRAARRASYQLIGTQDSMDSQDSAERLRQQEDGEDLRPTTLDGVAGPGLRRTDDAMHDVRPNARRILDALEREEDEEEARRMAEGDEPPHTPRRRSFRGDELGVLTDKLSVPSPFRRVLSHGGAPQNQQSTMPLYKQYQHYQPRNSQSLSSGGTGDDEESQNQQQNQSHQMQAKRLSLTWGDSIRSMVLGTGNDGPASGSFEKEPTSPLPTSALLSQPIPFRRTFSDQVSGSPSKHKRFPMGTAAADATTATADVGAASTTTTNPINRKPSIVDRSASTSSATSGSIRRRSNIVFRQSGHNPFGGPMQDYSESSYGASASASASATAAAASAAIFGDPSESSYMDMEEDRLDFIVPGGGRNLHKNNNKNLVRLTTSSTPSLLSAADYVDPSASLSLPDFGEEPDDAAAATSTDVGITPVAANKSNNRYEAFQTGYDNDNVDIDDRDTNKDGSYYGHQNDDQQDVGSTGHLISRRRTSSTIAGTTTAAITTNTTTATTPSKLKPKRSSSIGTHR